MFIARVKGHIVATAKDAAIKGQKLLIVEPLRVRYEHPETASDGSGRSEAGFEVTGRAIVAMDSIGAGERQLVLIVQGSSARMAKGFNKVPVDAVVVGIVDEAMVHGKRINE